jgi:NAD(P)-dependent dehydrogenase (short-subunit alcohol dehydrogenase family)
MVEGRNVCARSTGKMGVVGLTKTVAKEWGQFNIRCNALVYGTIKTRCEGQLPCIHTVRLCSQGY